MDTPRLALVNWHLAKIGQMGQYPPPAPRARKDEAGVVGTHYFPKTEEPKRTPPRLPMGRRRIEGSAEKPRKARESRKAREEKRVLLPISFHRGDDPQRILRRAFKRHMAKGANRAMSFKASSNRNGPNDTHFSVLILSPIMINVLQY